MAIADPGQPLVFARSTVMYRRLRVFEYVFYALLVPLVGALAYLIYIDMDGRWHEMLPAGAAFLALTIGMLVLSAVLQKRAIKPEFNNLRLDGSGLAYMRAGKFLRWSWGDVSAFELQFASSKRLMGRQRFITFAAPGTDWTWHVLRRVYGLPTQPPLVIIEDVYETPLDEIVETLNAYRDRALGGGTTDGAPGPSEPA